MALVLFLWDRVGRAERYCSPRGTLVRLAVVQALSLTAFIALALSFGPRVHLVAWLDIAVVLVLYAAASLRASVVAVRGGSLRALDEAISLAPMLAMLGTIAGFVIAFGASADDVQGRVLGASTGLAATFVGVACAALLRIQRYVIERDAD